MPVMHDSQYWVLQMDAALLLACGTVICKQWRHHSLRRLWCNRLSATDEAEIVERVQPIVRWQLFCFYLAAAAWKVNTSFLHPRYSCAGLFTLSLLDFLPPSVDPLLEPWTPWILSASPAAVLLLEFGVALGLLLDPKRLGVLTMLLLHLAIAVTPPPNNIGCFGVATCSRLCLLIPDATHVAIRELLTTASIHRASSFPFGVVVMAVAASVSMLTHTQHVAGSPVDLAVPLLVTLGAVYVRALTTHTRHRRVPMFRQFARRLGGGGRALVAVAIFQQFIGPILGTDMGVANMFSNLRMHGGSNHLLLPTGLMHRWLHDDTATSWAWLRPSFAGGIVRVEHTNLSSVNDMYPGDISGAFSRRTRARIAASGHHEGFFVPMNGRTAATDPGPPFVPQASPLTTAVPFTLRALELRRILAEARAAATPFTLTYTRLLGEEGDEAWRKYSRSGRVVTVTDNGGSSGRVCTYVAEACKQPPLDSLGFGSWLGMMCHLPCDAKELAHLPEPPTVGSWAGHVDKLLFGKPYPVLPSWDKEMPCSE